MLLLADTPRMHIVWSVPEAAKDAGNEIVIAACRRLIEADRLGWRKHHRSADWKLVLTLYESGVD